MRRLVALLVASLLLAAPASALAAGCPKTSLGAVESQVMCLQCGIPLNVAETAPAAQQERNFITDLVAQCRSYDQIKNALVAQYGDRVLALPRASGFGLAAYLVPALGFLAGVALVGALALRWRRARSLEAAGPLVANVPVRGREPGDAARLDADLKRYEL